MKGISVIVPAKGRVAGVRALLESLESAAQGFPEPVEILLVDDSDPAAAEQHRESCEKFGATYVPGPRHVGAKRNLGAEHAAHDLLMFIDSDCCAASDLLRRHSSTLRSADPDVGGVAGPTKLIDSDSVVQRIMSRGTLLNGDLERPFTHRQLLWATTSNLMVRREAFVAAGGFPEKSLTVVGGEDVEFGLRLVDKGYRIICDAEAQVTHSGSSETLRAVCRRLITYGRSEQWLCTVRPHRRSYRLNAVSATAAAIGVSLVLGERRPARLLAATLVTAGTVLGARVRRSLGEDRSPRALLENATCCAVEMSFDLGAAVAALELRRPDLLVSGFSVDESEYVITEGIGTARVRA